MDISTIAGIVAITMILVGVIVTAAKITDNNIKKIISVAVAVGLGIVAKLTGTGFVDMPWVEFISAIIAAILATKISYDAIIKPVMSIGKKKKIE